MGNNQLSAAKKAKNDEFYTRMTDIEHELVHYRDHFKGKVVLCNCDDPYESNFFKYFALNFNHLGLRKLIATSYCGSPVAGGEYQPSLFDDDMDADTGRHRHAYKAIVTHVEDTTGDGGVDMLDVKNLLGAPGQRGVGAPWGRGIRCRGLQVARMPRPVGRGGRGCDQSAVLAVPRVRGYADGA